MKKIAKIKDVFLGVTVCLVMAFIGIFFVGCENKYDALEISLSQSHIVLSLEDGDCMPQIVIAEVIGSKSISRQLNVSTEAPQLSISTQMSDEGQTVITVSASAVCTNAIVLVKTLEGGKSASFLVSVVEPVKMITPSLNAENFFVVKGQAKNLNNSELVDFQPKTTTQKNLDFALVGSPQNITLENGVLFVEESFTQNVVQVKITSPFLSGTEIIVDVNVLPQLSAQTVKMMSIEYQSTELEPIFNDGDVLPNQIVLSSNLAARQSVVFSLKVESNKHVDVMPYVLSTLTASSDVLSFTSAEKNELVQAGELVSTEFKFVLSAKDVSGQDSIYFSVSFLEYRYSYTTKQIKVVVKDSVNKLELYADNNLSNQTIFTVYDVYKNKKGLMLSFNALPTTISDEEKVLVLELGVNAEAYKFWTDDSEEPIIFVNNKFEFMSGQNIYISATSHTALNGQIKVFAKENPVVKQTLSLKAGAGTTSMAFINAAEVVQLPDNQGVQYFYNLSSNTQMMQVVKFTTDANDISALNLEISGNVVQFISAPVVNGDHFEFTIKSEIGKQGTAVLTLRQANGYYVQAFVRVVYELMENEVSFSVPSAQTNAFVGFMERSLNSSWQFRVAVKLGGSVTLTQTGGGVESLTYQFYDTLKASVSDEDYANFFAQTSQNLQTLTYQNGSDVLDTKLLNINELKPKTVGKTWIKATASGFEIEETEQNGEVKRLLKEKVVEYFFLVEGYVPVSNFALSTYAVSLYSQNSVGYEDLNLTRTSIVLGLNDATYQDVSWLNVSETFSVMGNDVYKTSLSQNNTVLDVEALSTWAYENGNLLQKNKLDFAFVVVIKEFNTEYRLAVNVQIVRAQQVEKILVENVNVQEGIYIPLMRDGKNITRQISATVQVGESGIIPFNNSLVYEFLPYLNASTNVAFIDRTTGLLTVNQSSQNGTVGVLRIAPADRYNINNLYEAGENDVAIYISLVVADGQTRATAYRITSLDGFMAFSDDTSVSASQHFVLLNDIEITTQNSFGETVALFENFGGGLYGALENDDVVHQITTALPLFGTVLDNACVEDLFISGNVQGNAFVAIENKGKIQNVQIVAQKGLNVVSSPSVINPLDDAVNIGGIAAINQGQIIDSTFSGQIINQNLTSISSVGAIAGTSSGKIDGCVVEFCTYVDSFLPDATVSYDKISVGGASLGALVGTISDGTLTNSYVQSYVALENAETLLITSGLYGVLAGKVLGGEIDQCFGHVQNHQNVYGASADGSLIKNAYITFKASDDAEVFGKFIANYEEISYLGNPSVFNAITNTEVWDKTTILPTFKNIKLKTPILKIQETFNAISSVFSGLITINGKAESAALMFLTEINETLSLQEQIALNNLNFFAFNKLFSGNLYGLEAFSSNPQVVQVAQNGLKLVSIGQTQITFFSKYNPSINITYSIFVLNPILAPEFNTGTGTFKDADVLNIKASSGFGFVLQTNNNLVLDQRTLENKLQNYQIVFEGVDVVGNNPFSINTQVLPTGHTQVQFDVFISGTNFDEQIAALIGENFRGVFVLNVFNGADKLEVSHSSVVMEPYDTAELEVNLFTDTSMSNGEYLIIETLKHGNFPSDVFNTLIECTAVKYYLGADLETLTTEALAKYYVYTFKVQFLVKEQYRSLDFSASAFQFNITANSSMLAQNSYGASMPYAVCEVVVNTQEILSVSTNHYEKTNKSILRDFETGKNFVFYEYNTRQPSNVLAPGEEGLLKIDLYPNYARYDYVDITYQASTQGISMQLVLMEKYIDPQSGIEGFRQQINGYLPIDNGIRIFNNNQLSSQAVTTLYIGTYLPISTNKDAVFELALISSNSEVQTQETTFNLIVEYVDDAIIEVVDDLGQKVPAVARGASTNLLITLPKEQNLSLDYINILGVAGTQITPENSILIGRQQIIEDENSLTRTFKYLLTVGKDVVINQNANFVTVEVSMSWIAGGKLQKKTSTITLSIVDFVVKEVTLATDRADETTFYSYIGVQSSLNFNFKTQPSQSDALTEFLNKKYYEALSDVNAVGGYVVNYDKEDYGTFLANLYYVNGAFTYPLLNADGSYEANNYFTFVDDNGIIKLTGTRQGEVQLRFIMTVQYPHPTVQQLYEIEFDFTVVVQPFSDEDLPLIIDNENAFYDALNAGTAQDYILMANLSLENYTPLNTTALNSLDGNNYIITIKSFASTDNLTNINLALFNQVEEHTTLKNITLNICLEQEVLIDVDFVSQLNVSGIAIENNGIIYNCAVVTSTALAKSTSGKTGLEIKYSKEYIGTNLTSTISGFVGTNNGFITNSRVGGEYFETAISTNQPLEVFNIMGQGNISGFVDTNNGTIASSFFSSGTLTNNSIGSLLTTTSGFARLNNGVITTSYAKGTGDKAFSLTGKGITTSGISAGFIGINNGQISDCYANIFLASTTGVSDYQTGRLSAGFVHNNMGTITSCFTASKIQNAKTTQMAFVGVDENSNLLNSGTIKYSYYYNDDELEGDAYSDAKSNLNVVRVAEPNNPESFYGFAFASSASSVNGVWFASSFGIDLVSANQIAISSRYVANQKVDAVTGELLSYNLPYTDGFDYGSVKNPIVIRSAQEFNKVFGGDDAHAGTAISRYYSLGQAQVYGHYRIIANINLQDLNPDTSSQTLKSTEMSLYGGVIDGNMLTVSGVDITAQSDSLIQNYGLFKSLENGACIKNLSVEVVAVSAKQARFVGALAGTIENSKAVSITISAQENASDVTILGNNVVGGLAGIVKGDSQIKNITVSNLAVKANALATGAENKYQRNLSGTNINTSISYAGGVIGAADIFEEAEKTSSYHKTDSQIANLSNLVVSGVVNIRASSAGGVIGYVGPQTNLRDATLEILATEASKIVAYNFFAGGIVAECYGNIDMVKAQHDAPSQKEIENNVSEYYHNPGQPIQRGNLTLFDDTSDGNIISTYTPIGIGGLIGALYAGDLTHSYSKLNVISGAAHYAGGLVGGILPITNPQAERNKINFFEVYAFGDVRGQLAAGGVVGYIDSTRILTMAKVNAVNFWGLELDKKENAYALPENVYQIYALTNTNVGVETVDSLVSYDNQTNTATVIKGSLPIITCTSNSDDMFSVSAVKFNNGKQVLNQYVKQSFAYMVGKEPFNMVFDPYYGLQDDEKTTTDYLSTQAITPYYDLIDVSTNGIAMDTYFIQANWDTHYWVRYSSTQDLLPSLVTYTESMSYYIDVAEDLQKMVYHPYATFIVRALNQPSKIIPVGHYIESTGIILNNFYGTLKGLDQSQNYGLDFEGKTSFIMATTGASFYNLTFTNLGANGSAYTALNQAIIDIATLTTFENILISNSFSNTEANKDNYNIGILANKMLGGYLNNISLQDCKININVQRSISSQDLPKLNVGMLAGQIETNSGAMLQMSDVCVYQSYGSSWRNSGQNNISINLNAQNLEQTQINVGALVGETSGSVGITFTAQRLTNGQSKHIGIANFTNGEKYVMEKAKNQATNGTKISLSGGGVLKSFNAGLLFGKTSTTKIGFMGTAQNQKLQVVGGIEASGTKPQVQSANVGGIIGKVETSASIQNTLETQTKFLEVDANITFDAQVLNAGMLFGSAATIQDIANIETFGQINANSNTLSTLGGLVGSVNSTLNISSTTSNTVIRSQGALAFIGGMIGQYAPLVGTLTVGDTNANTKFAGDISANGEELYVGGILGAVKTQKGADAQVNIKFVASGGSISIGQVSGALYAGGVLGSAKANLSETTPKISISNTLAYGEIKVHYNLAQEIQSTIAIGGVVGLGTQNTTLSGNTSLESVASKTSATLDGVNIGAIIGIGGNAKQGEALNYYSHQVCLCLELDEHIGATNLYYSRTDQTLDTSDAKTILAIKDVLEDYEPLLSANEKLSGTKLNPIIISSAADYALNQNTMQAQKETQNKVYMLITKPFSLNVAPVNLINTHIIGDGYEITTQNNLFNILDENSNITGISLIPSISNISATDGAAGTLANVNNGFVFASVVKTTNISAHQHTSLAFSGAGYVGGLVGRNNGVIMDSMTSINIIAGGNGGSLVGYNCGVIISSYAVGTISGGYAFSVGNGSIYSCYTAAKADKGVFGTNQTVEDSYYDIYSTGVMAEEKQTTDTNTFSVLDKKQNQKLLFVANSSEKKFEFVVGKNFGYPSFGGAAYGSLSYMHGINTGDGTEENPIMISSVGKLQQINYAETPNLHYVLITDIALTNDMKQVAVNLEDGTKTFNGAFHVANWKPITNFEGTLSGKYGDVHGEVYTIKNLSTGFAEDSWAIFGTVNNSKISYIKIQHDTLSVNATLLAGLAVSINGTTLDNIIIDATEIKSESRGAVKIGALVATANAETVKNTISNIFLNVNSISTQNDVASAVIGGLVAEMPKANLSTNISNINFSSSLKITSNCKGQSTLGGFIGSAQNIDAENVNMENITISSEGTGASNLGGLFGTTNNLSYATKSINAKGVSLITSSTASQNNLGGVVGAMEKSTFDEVSVTLSGVGINMKGSGKLLAGSVAGSAVESNIFGLSPSLSVRVEQGGQNHIGGIVGEANSTTLSDYILSLNTQSIILNSEESTATNYIGGIVGSAKNMRMEDCSVVGDYTTYENKSLGVTYLGGIAGTMEGSELTKSKVQDTQFEGSRVGAVAGMIEGSTLEGIILNGCSIKALFTESGGGYAAYAGGVASEISESTLSGIEILGGKIEVDEVPEDSTPITYIGGISGTFSGKVSGLTTSIATEISIATGGYAGGAFGKTFSSSVDGGTTISDITMTGKVTAILDETQAGQDLCVGGITGSLTGKMTNINFLGSSVRTNAPSYVGGLAGYAEATFEDCTVGGNITEISSYEQITTPTHTAVGGAVGFASNCSFSQVAVGGQVVNGQLIKVLSTIVSGTYAAGGIVGIGENLTFKGNKVVYNDRVVVSEQCYNYATVQAALKANSTDVPLVTEAYAGGIVGKLSGGKMEYCENYGIVEAGWQDTASMQLNSRDMFYYTEGNNGDDEDKQYKTLEKLAKKVHEINEAATGIERSYAGGIVGVSSGATLENLVNAGSVDSHAKVTLELKTAKRYEGVGKDPNIQVNFWETDSYAHYAKETETAYSAGIAITNDALGENNQNTGNIQGGGITEFNIFTTDDSSFDNHYKSYVLDYSFNYNKDGTKTDVKNSFEAIYENDKGGTQAWINAQKEGLKLVASDTGQNEYIHYGDPNYPIKYSDFKNEEVIITFWDYFNQVPAETYSSTVLHHFRDSYFDFYMPQQEVINDGLVTDDVPLLTLTHPATHNTHLTPAVFFEFDSSTMTMTGPYSFIQAEEVEIVDPTNPENVEISTRYTYYQPVIANGIIHYGGPVVVEPGTGNWINIHRAYELNGYLDLSAGVSFVVDYLGGGCVFPNLDNLETQEFAYNLSTSNGEVYVSNTSFNLESSIKLIKIYGENAIPVVSDEGEEAEVQRPDKEPYDKGNMRPAIWGQDFDVLAPHDDGREVWQFAVYNDFGDLQTRQYLHWYPLEEGSDVYVLRVFTQVVEKLNPENDADKYNYQELDFAAYKYTTAAGEVVIGHLEKVYIED